MRISDCYSNLIPQCSIKSQNSFYALSENQRFSYFSGGCRKRSVAKKWVKTFTYLFLLFYFASSWCIVICLTCLYQIKQVFLLFMLSKKIRYGSNNENSQILWNSVVNKFFIKRDRVTDLLAVVRKNVENYSVLFKLTDCKIWRT